MNESIKKTMDLMTRLIKKPPLTAKLLSKPPFRYLHDMISELIKTTNFAAGLYAEEEQNSENVKEKDAKIAYLTKIIDVVGISTGVLVKANPAKIVAGMEPEETNAFLQLLAKAILKKVDSSLAVRRVLAGEHQTKRSSSKSSSQPLNANITSPITSPSKSEQRLESGNPRQTSSLNSLMGKNDTGNSKLALDSNLVEAERFAEQDQSTPNLKKELSTDLANSSASVQQQENKPPALHDTSPKQGMVTRKANARPASARAPPPKVRANKELAPEALVAAPTVFVENNKKDDDDDDDAFVVVVDSQSTFKNDQNSAGVSNNDDGNHGALVRKILETKKELENREDSAEQSDREESLALLPKDKQIAKKEIDSLRQSIQFLCRSTNPLGKTLDYIQEDVDGMNRELEMWVIEGAKWGSKMDDESAKTDSELAPLEKQLQEIEQKIEEKYQQISFNKGLMMQNEGCIQKLMHSIMHPTK